MEKTYWYLLVEASLLFVGAPLLFYWDVLSIPKITALVLAAGYCGVQLWRDSEFDKSNLGDLKIRGAGDLIISRLPIVLIALVGLVAVLHPDRFFAFPAQRPYIWIAVMVLYPVLSALPQELIFRTYFFHRYEHLLPTKYGAVVGSALAFSFLHIIYDNWWAVGLSFIAGILFGLTYMRTRSLFWVTVEHSIYGCLVFTLGMGEYFYEAF